MGLKGRASLIERVACAVYDIDLKLPYRKTLIATSIVAREWAPSSKLDHERLTGWAPVRFLRNMIGNYDRTKEGPRAVKKLEDGVEVVGRGVG